MKRSGKNRGIHKKQARNGLEKPFERSQKKIMLKKMNLRSFYYKKVNKYYL